MTKSHDRPVVVLAAVLFVISVVGGGVIFFEFIIKPFFDAIF